MVIAKLMYIKNIKILSIVNVCKYNFLLQRIAKIYTSESYKILQSNIFYSEPDQSILNKTIDKLTIKDETPIYLTLLSGKKISVTFKVAKTLSVKEKLVLVKVDKQDNSNDKPLYKLVQPVKTKVDKNAIEKPAKRKSQFKSIMISPNINDHDLKVKIKQLVKFLKQNLYVDVKLQKKSKTQEDSSKPTILKETILKELKDLYGKQTENENDFWLRLMFEPLKKDTKNVKSSLKIKKKVENTENLEDNNNSVKINN